MTDDVITDAAGDELEHGAPDFPGQFPLGRDCDHQWGSAYTEVVQQAPDGSFIAVPVARADILACSRCGASREAFPLGRDWMVKTMTDNARSGSPLSPLEALVAEMRAAWEAYDRDGSRRIDEAIEALERYAEANP